MKSLESMTTAELRKELHHRIGNRKVEALAAQNRVDFNAQARIAVNLCDDFRDVAALMGEWWMRELMPDGAKPSDKIGDKIRDRMIGSLSGVWAGRRRKNILQDAVRIAVDEVRRQLRDKGVSIGCSEDAAKILLIEALGGTIEPDVYPSTVKRDAQKECRNQLD